MRTLAIGLTVWSFLRATTPHSSTRPLAAKSCLCPSEKIAVFEEIIHTQVQNAACWKTLGNKCPLRPQHRAPLPALKSSLALPPVQLMLLLLLLLHLTIVRQQPVWSPAEPPQSSSAGARFLFMLVQLTSKASVVPGFHSNGVSAIIYVQAKPPPCTLITFAPSGNSVTYKYIYICILVWIGNIDNSFQLCKAIANNQLAL